MMARLLFLILASTSVLASSSEAAAEAAGRRGGSGGRRNEKLLTVFQIIRFQNSICPGANGVNGTCYTQEECSDRGGTNGGSCASGFGVCCQISLSCGGMSSENCTYFNSANIMAGGCQATICPCNDNICQLRLDFQSFSISGPSTNTASVTKRLLNSGVVAPAGTVKVSQFTQCLTDTFSVSNSDGPNPPTICGINTGEHMYVESADDCNILSFLFGATGNGAAIANRQFSIKVSQLSCNHPNLAPQGCTQYFFGEQFGTVRSFNYNNRNGLHLANQDQNICVRREQGQCRLCWTLDAVIDFGLSGMMVGVAKKTASLCCSYAKSLEKKSGFDCIQIPGAVKATVPGLPTNSNICGNTMNLPQATTCTTLTPFAVNFRSDEFDISAEEAGIAGRAGNVGFELVYFMDNNGCNPASIG